MLLPAKILVPLDGSGNSSRACEFALDLAKKVGSSVVLVHVIEIPVSSYKYRRVARSVLEVLEDAGWEILSAEETRAHSKGVPVEVVLTSGDPANKILSVTKSKSCDCIVMGKRGRGRIQRLLLGSVSDQVARLSEVPVVIVK